MRKKSFVNKENAQDRASYRTVIKRIIKDNVCPFCPEHFLKYHTRPILKKGKHWLVTENMNPYRGTRKHFLFVHNRHIEGVNKITAPAWKELLGHIQWLAKKYKLSGAGLFMRFGDTRYTGGSVAHLHVQILSGVRMSNKTFLIGPTLGFGKKEPSSF